jgi:hypothetical protein
VDKYEASIRRNKSSYSEAIAWLRENLKHDDKNLTLIIDAIDELGQSGDIF